MNVYDIKDFGGVADGKTLNTSAFQNAINASHDAGGGRVFCGAGNFMTGAIKLKSNVELYLAAGCRIIGSRSLSDYEQLTAPGFVGDRTNLPELSSESLISAVEAENIAVMGPGEINGSGPAFYDTASTSDAGQFSKPSTPRPRMIMFYNCSNVRLEGVTLVDSPCWTVWLMKCRNVNVHRIQIRADHRLRNVDGIDIDSCSNVTVSDSLFDTEDDCLVIRSINNMYDAPAACENVTINNCVLASSCQGVRIGCPGDGVIRNCVLSNLIITGQNNGVVFNNPAFYLPKGSRGSADIRNIIFSNLIIDCARHAVKIDVDEGVELVYLGDISFSGVRAKSGSPILIKGSKETIVRNVSFSNMTVETSGSDAVIFRNCEGLKFVNVEVLNHQ